MFEDMMDGVHIDENWFYLSLNNLKYYLVNEEGGSYITTNSKWFKKVDIYLCGWYTTLGHV